MTRRSARAPVAIAVVASVARFVSGGHNDMFSCRSKNCPVAELTDSNYAATISGGAFVMFYAPWCGHCKQLAPKLKKAAKELSEWGVTVGAVDVEPNRQVQSMYPDIRGFPTLKYVTSTSKAEDYNGPREADDIVAFAKEQASKAGSLQEPMPHKTLDELYAFFARAALDSLPALLLAGDAATPDAPAWFAGMHAALRSDKADSYEAAAKAKLDEAFAAASSASVKDAIKAVLDDIAAKAKAQSKPMFSAAYTADAAALATGVFNASTLYVAHVDRKKLAASTLCAYYSDAVLTKSSASSRKKSPRGGAPSWDPALEAFARAAAGTAPPSDCGGGTLVTMPELPKPASVLAAEERAAKKKAKATEVALVASAEDLAAKCYELKDRTCAIVLGGAAPDELAPVAAKYAREGFAFVSLASPPDELVAALNGGTPPTEPALVIVKGGRRPRAARVAGLASFDSLLDDVLGGGAKFDKFADGLPAWVSASTAEDDAAGDEYDL